MILLFLIIKIVMKANLNQDLMILMDNLDLKVIIKKIKNKRKYKKNKEDHKKK